MNTTTNGNGSGRIKDIEREIDQDRSHFIATLSALENKFSPGQIVDQVLNYLKRNGGDFSDNLVKTVTQNPIPTVLTGVGMAWMAIGSGRADKRGGQHEMNYDNGFYDRTYVQGMSFEQEFVDQPNSPGKLSALTDSTGHLKENIAHSAQKATDKAKHFADDARHSAEALAMKSKQQWTRTSQGARDFFVENPLAAGAVAIAVGAILGALLPISTVEKEMLGSTGKE